MADVARGALLALLALALLTPPAGARPVVGIAEQSPRVFDDPAWRALGTRDVRYVVSWNATRDAPETREIDAYLAAAERSGARVLLSFGLSRADRETKVLPSVRRYRAAFRAFRRRWPQVRTFVPWNEANHCSQPTCRRPDRVAAYYDTMRSVCRRCTVVAADVLDTPDMAEWLRAFMRHARHKPRIWGLHNYLDANRFRTVGTRTLLRTVPGQVWFTETGGVVRRKKRSKVTFEESADHAAEATEWVFRRLARQSPRVRRVYLYHWVQAGKDAQWDSALVTRGGRTRPAYDVLLTWVRRLQRAERLARLG